MRIKDFRLPGRHWNFLWLCISALMGFGAVWLIGGIRALDCTSSQWIFNYSASSDMAQHQLGWMFFRQAPWKFPLGLFNTLCYPLDNTVGNMDAIPLFAIFFKLISPVLPKDFQYMGLFCWLSFALIFYFAGLILRKYCDHIVPLIVGCSFFLVSPVLLFRIFAHTALCSQFLLLAGIYLILQKDYTNKSILRWMILLCAAISIQAYLFLMLLFLFAGFLINSILTQKNIKFAAIATVACGVGSLACMYTIGFFSGGGGFGAGGFGLYSANLLTFFDSYGLTNMPMFPHATEGQYEGFAYLGAGMFPLLLFAIISLEEWYRKNGKSQWKILTGLLFASASAFLFGLSNVITFSGKILWTIPMPSWLSEIVSIGRTSGRFVWIFYYLIYLFCFYMIFRRIKNKVLISVVLLALLGLQIYDVMPLIKVKQLKDNEKYQTSLISSFWEDAKAQNIEHLITLPTNNQSSQNLFYSKRADYALLALKNNFTLNTFYFSRMNNEVVLSLADDEYQKIFAGNLKPDTMFVLNPFSFYSHKIFYYPMSGLLKEASVFSIDGALVVTEKNALLEEKYGTSDMRAEGVPALKSGMSMEEVLGFTTITDMGICQPEGGSFLSANDTILLQNAEIATKGLLLDMAIPGQHLASMHGDAILEKSIVVKVNGEEVLNIPVGNVYLRKTFLIPPEKLRTNQWGVYVVEISAPTFIPKKIGLNEDERTLSVILFSCGAAQ